MREFINRLTGTRMAVADEREAEYLAAGHRPAGAPSDPGPRPAPASFRPPGSASGGDAASQIEKKRSPALPQKTACAARQKSTRKK